jgi:hypothetical protein
VNTCKKKGVKNESYMMGSSKTSIYRQGNQAKTIRMRVQWSYEPENFAEENDAFTVNTRQLSASPIMLQMHINSVNSFK